MSAHKQGSSYLNEYLTLAAEHPGIKVTLKPTGGWKGPPWADNKSSAGVTKHDIENGDIPGPFEGQAGRFKAEIVPFNAGTVTLNVWQDVSWLTSVSSDGDGATSDWYVLGAHARRAIGYLGASLAETEDLHPDFEQPRLLDLWGEALQATMDVEEMSPMGRVQ